MQRRNNIMTKTYLTKNAIQIEDVFLYDLIERINELEEEISRIGKCKIKWNKTKGKDIVLRIHIQDEKISADVNIRFTRHVCRFFYISEKQEIRNLQGVEPDELMDEICKHLRIFNYEIIVNYDYYASGYYYPYY